MPLKNNNKRAIVANVGIKMTLYGKTFATAPAKNIGNAISPPPKIAALNLFFETLYGTNKPAKIFSFVWNLANLIMCFVYQTAIISYIDIPINSIEAENMFRTGMKITAIPA